MARFKAIPWKVLFAIATLTVLVFTLLDLGLRLLSQRLAALDTFLQLLLNPGIGTITSFAVGFVLGLSAVFCLEKSPMTTHVSINLSALWSLILCLAIALWIRSFFQIYGVFVTGLGYTDLVGIVCGVFWYSQRYWRYKSY